MDYEYEKKKNDSSFRQILLSVRSKKQVYGLYNALNKQDDLL